MAVFQPKTLAGLRACSEDAPFTTEFSIPIFTSVSEKKLAKLREERRLQDQNRRNNSRTKRCEENQDAAWVSQMQWLEAQQRERTRLQQEFEHRKAMERNRTAYVAIFPCPPPEAPPNPPDFCSIQAGLHLRNELTDPPGISPRRGFSGPIAPRCSPPVARSPHTTSHPSYPPTPMPAYNAASTGPPPSLMPVENSLHNRQILGYGNNPLTSDDRVLGSRNHAPAPRGSAPLETNHKCADQLLLLTLERLREYRYQTAGPRNSSNVENNSRDYFTRSYAVPPPHAVDTSENGNLSFFDNSPAPKLPDKLPGPQEAEAPVVVFGLSAELLARRHRSYVVSRVRS
ncbi:uncharacterized protein BDZ99DRAFT_524315 [Mytilinidion resinicola]|uniref:Uncharacterized protein n=1 Tax=Mytilinidion resinicola TaxID=574789 RepID=A0A6A6YBV0_9PEZI|nr:uncharacterized protein BDZ99DRAFT_524315 [Mytilinidion resinicola]KAF2806089.1 hypothetical protein BDZ99DRAFT_524315 [Mytilinidion resinicola]